MLLSRTAQTIYWMSRYLERAENAARIISVNANVLLDLPNGVAPGWEPLLAITGSAPLFFTRYEQASERNVVKFLVSDRKNPSSIISSLAQAREGLRTTRAVFPQGAWEILNDLYYFVEENKAQGLTRKGRYDYLKHIVRSCQAMAGNMSGSMSHDKSYEFLRIGRYIERADMTTRVLEVRAVNLMPEQVDELKPFDDIQWKSVLDSLACYQMYRRHVHVRVKGPAVLSYLVQDMQFPRSILYCLGEVEDCLRSLPNNEAALRAVGRAQRRAAGIDAHDLAKTRLSDFSDEQQIALAKIHEQIAASFFQMDRSKPTKTGKARSVAQQGSKKEQAA